MYKGKQLHLLPASSLEANFWRICQTAFAHRSKIWKSFSIQNQQVRAPAITLLLWFWAKNRHQNKHVLKYHYFGCHAFASGFLSKNFCSFTIEIQSCFICIFSFAIYKKSPTILLILSLRLFFMEIIVHPNCCSRLDETVQRAINYQLIHLFKWGEPKTRVIFQCFQLT